MRKALLPLTLALVAFAAGMYDISPAMAQEGDLYNEVYIPGDGVYELLLAYGYTCIVFTVSMAAILALAAMIRGGPDQK